MHKKDNENLISKALLPYKVSKLLKKHKIKTIFTSDKKLKLSMIYDIPCKNCDKVHMVQTNRNDNIINVTILSEIWTQNCF